MASSILIFFIFFPFYISKSTPILPKAAFIPVTKDPSSLQYVATLSIGKDLTTLNLVLDLNNPYVWLNHDNRFNPVGSSSLECSMVDTPQSNSQICSLQARNTISEMSTSADLNEGMVAFEFWDEMGFVNSFAKIDHFLFPFAPKLLLQGLGNNSKGMLGLGNSRISLSSQFFGAFGFFGRKFTLSLSSFNGGIFLGGTPNLGSNVVMMYTPLITKKDGYYINVKSIKISGKKLKQKVKWDLSEKGFYTKISTIAPYTVMESKIYKTFVEAYVRAADSMNLSLVDPVAPFGACFSSDNKTTKNAVPVIDVVLQSEMVKWRIHGRNSLVDVGDGVMCLGFVDGGFSTEGFITIGGFQLEDYVLEFDLANSMLGFSSSLLIGHETCTAFSGSGLCKKKSFVL